MRLLCHHLGLRNCFMGKCQLLLYTWSWQESYCVWARCLHFVSFSFKNKCSSHYFSSFYLEVGLWEWFKKKIKTECPVWNSDCSYLCLKSSFLQWFCLHMNRESRCSEQDPMSTCGICEFITNSSQEMDFTDFLCPFQLRMFHGSFSHSAFSLFIQLGICKAKKL